MSDGYQKATREQAETHFRQSEEAFSFNLERALAGLDADLVSRTRVVLRGADVAAGLFYFDAGQWFGGKRLRCWPIGCVVTAAHHRGVGAGRELMLGMLHEARDAGVPLSVLYASTPTFYRKCGYEPAGLVIGWGVASHQLPRFPDALRAADIVPFAPDDTAVRACYAQRAAAANGTLDRDAPLWERKLKPDEGKRYCYRFDFAGQTEGYVSISGDRSDGLGVEDYAATTLRARHAILTFLHDHRSVNGKVAWYGGPQDALRRMIPENRAEPRRHTEEWLLRITDVAAALRQRGYPTLDAELHLDVADASMPANTGRCVLTLRGGNATVEPGGEGRIQLDVRGLAALFTSHCTAEELAATGLARGSADDLALASLVFAGPSPFMVDKF